jgi:ZIP family zinc transporter
VQPLSKILMFALLPMGSAIIGGIISIFRPPTPKVRSYIQHFAAGIVFSVVAVELLPDIVKRHLPWEVALGFGAGVALMLGLKAFTKKSEASQPGTSAGLLAGVGIDIFIDGLLIGIGFAAGSREGLLLTIALTIELLSLGLAVAASLTKAGTRRRKTVATIAALSSLIVLAAILGATLLRNLSGEATEVVLAFGLAALLFLVTEELLVEAHEEPETPLATTIFFGGFLLFLIMGITK